MGRTIIADDTIDNQLATLYNKDKWLIGLIIGQTSEQKDYALYLAPTPKSDSDEVISKSPKNRKPYSLDSVDESWVSIHARQVLRMLPGGLDVLGVFGMAGPDMMKAAQPKLRQILFAIHKVSCQSQGGSTDSEVSKSTDRVILQICPQSRKLTCRTFDVTDNKSSARPAEWKYQRIIDRWHRLETSTALELTIPVHNTAMSQSLEKQILHGIRPICDNIWNSIATIDHQMAAGDRLLVPSQPQVGKKGRKQQEESVGQTFSVQLYGIHAAMDRDKVRDPRLTPCGATLSVRGTVCSRAFVHGKATLDEAVKALKTDVVRTITSRCELLCEDLLQSEEEQDPKVVYETPLRVFVPLQQESSIQLCDYMFQDETNNDVVDRFKELLDLHIPEDLVETDCERIPDETDLAKPEKTEDLECDPDPSVRKNRQKSLNTTVIALCVLALFLSVLVAYLYQTDSGSG